MLRMCVTNTRGQYVRNCTSRDGLHEYPRLTRSPPGIRGIHGCTIIQLLTTTIQSNRKFYRCKNIRMMFEICSFLLYCHETLFF